MDRDPPTVFISIIVPIYNDWHLIPCLLTSLKNQSIDSDAFEVLLIDNGSDHIPDLPTLPSNTQVLTCKTPGSYAARNYGLQYAEGSLLAFTDADCRPTESWLKNALVAHKKNETALLAGAIKMVPVSWENMTATEEYEVALGIPQARYVTKGYAATANLFVPATLFKKYGHFDATRFSGGDSEFCRRLTNDGVELQYCADALILHPARSSWRNLVKKKRRVKGGQITSGSKIQRLTWIIRTLLPPVFVWQRIIFNSSLKYSQKLSICWTETRLWGIDNIELFGLLLGKQPVR